MDIRHITSSVIAAWSSSDRQAEPPQSEILEVLIRIAFEASLLREEDRSLAFRLIFLPPGFFPGATGPSEGSYKLPFSAPRPFRAQELRRLTPAVDHDRSLVGVHLGYHGELQIWGIVHSGPRWLEQFYGRRGSAFDLPDGLIIGVRAPGYMLISRGSQPLCALEGGVLQDNRLNVFDSQWFADFFAGARHELSQLHEEAKAESELLWATIDPDFTRTVARQMIQRLISTVQRSRHGGTLLVMPASRARELGRPDAWISLKYQFAGAKTRSRFLSLVVRAMNTLAAAGADAGPTVGWEDYGRSPGPELTNLDEAIFELAHMIATLTAVDGAVLITQSFELLGFGGEIACSLPTEPFVARALDLEGVAHVVEPTEDVGTRHRSVYRLCRELRDVLGIVVSQDGGATFVRWNNSQVMSWKHSPIALP